MSIAPPKSRDESAATSCGGAQSLNKYGVTAGSRWTRALFAFLNALILSGCGPIENRAVDAADDTDSVQRAVDSGGVVRFAPRTYHLSRTIVAAGISVIAALHTTIDHVLAESFDGQPLYSYVSKELTITNSEGRGSGVLNEFAATVDLNVRGNRFSEADAAAALGIDLGTAFFDVSDNSLDISRNLGAYLLYGVHDGSFSGNTLGFVSSVGNAFGILAWGTQRISISNNYLVGGEGLGSTGISVRAYAGEVLIPSIGVALSGNTFGSEWAFDYEPGTKASP